MSAMVAPITLLKGDDAAVLRDEVHKLVGVLVGGEDRSLVVEEVEIGATPPDGDGRDPLVALVDAAQTPPFLTEFRVVVGRMMDKREKNELVQPLVDYLVDPLATTRLVLAWHSGKIPKALGDAVTRSGGQIVDTSPGRKMREWLEQHLSEAGLKVDTDGKKRLAAWVGEEPGRVLSLVEVLRSTYGAGTKITAEDIEPFLGDDGGVPPWDLTDAIDRGDRKTALELLQRMIGQGDRHPFQVLATLHTHYARILRLEGSDAAGEREAAELLGTKGSTFMAKKALGQARRLGHDKVVRAIDLLAAADLDLRGGKAWPAPLVLEVLVARLASLAK